MTKTYELLKLAIKTKQQIICNYRGYSREICPHVIGTKGNATHVLSFQFGGGSSSGLPSGGEWRCMNVDKISNVELRQGDWYSDDSHSQNQTCVDCIDVEVDY